MFSVLLADDEKVICEGLRALIDWEALGFEVCAAAKNGLEILELAEEYKPHLLITDIKMPKMDGLKAIAELRRRNADIEILILSGFAEFEYARQALEQGARGYLMKPVDDAELSSQLKQIYVRLMAKKELQNQRIGRYLLMLCGQTKSIDSSRHSPPPLIEDAEYSLILVDYVLRGDDFVEVSSLSELELRLSQCLEEPDTAALYNGLLSYASKNMKDKAWVVPYEHGCMLFACDTAINMNDLHEKFGQSHLRFMIGEKAECLSKVEASFTSLNKCRLQYFYSKYDNDTVSYDDFSGNTTAKYELMDIEAVVSHIGAYRLSDAIETLKKIGDQIQERRYAPPLVEAYINLFITRLALFYDETCKMGHELYRIGEKLKTGVRRTRLCDLLYILELTLSLVYQAALKAGKEGDKGVINEVMNFMKVKYNEKITLKTVSEYFFLNPAYLGQLFRRKAGVSFNEYLSQIRMEKARILLLSTNKSISEISSDVGFDDPNYFSVAFSKKEGMTPREYRMKKKIY